MKHILFGSETCKASIAILIKESYLNKGEILKHYIRPLGADPTAFIAFSLWHDDNGKAPATYAKDYLKDLLGELDRLSIKTIVVTDAAYFKFLTRERKADVFSGYILNSQFTGWEDKFKIIYIPNYRILSFNPQVQTKIDMGLATLKQFTKNTYHAPGYGIVHKAIYPKRWADTVKALELLKLEPELTVDIETRGLSFWKCGIATISFAIDEHNFVSFPVDRGTFPKPMRLQLKKFFTEYTGKIILHSANFDLKVLTYELWMKDLQDYRGMIEGISILTRDFDDTKIIAYLATNNAVENILSLKKLAAEFAGNYAEENIADTDLIDLPDLLRYNGIDAISTWYVMKKYYKQMVADNQRSLYESLFKPSIITLLQTELVGLPIFPNKVREAKTKLLNIVQKSKQALLNMPAIQEFHKEQKVRLCAELTAGTKKKIFKMNDPKILRFEFNPNSPTQLSKLFYDYMGLPIIDKTDTGQPAAGGKTIKKLLNRTKNKEYISILEALLEFATANKILTTFIPAFEKAVKLPDGSYRLYGNFNIGGTLSGRLSSSDPNLTNLPSKSHWGKLIKECFGCIDGWLFGGADFNSLEDMVSALTTRDPNKLKVYTDGYDGHSLRAFYYFRDKLTGIIDTVASINSIKKIFPTIRQDSKAPTFLLTYAGTYHGLMDKIGFSEEDAKRIEANYHELYKISDKWVAEHIKKATKSGYVTGAFGLRLRTPLLAKASYEKMHYLAKAESRTAGNMLGQSYCMLNMRAANEFRERVWASKYKYDILVCAQIHDAIYVIWKDQAGIAKWINDNLIASMQWCGLKELQHPVVKLGAELDIFYPNWNNGISIPNYATIPVIRKVCNDAVKELKK